VTFVPKSPKFRCLVVFWLRVLCISHQAVMPSS